MKLRLPFAGPSYEARSRTADAQRTLNCFVEMDNNTPRAPVAIYGTPGTVLKATIGAGPHRGAIKEGPYVYIVSGSGVYRMNSAYTATLLGNLSTSTGMVGIASSGSQILIVDGASGAVVTTASGAFAVVADPDFPNGVKRVAYQDGYFVVTANGTQQFYINESPNNGLVWNGLDFASAEGAPDPSIGVISNHREVIFFGDTSAEIWTNTGNADFPFERSGQSFIEHGCASADTICKLDNTVFWLGTDDRGGPVVWKLDGYQPVRISDHALEKAMQNYGSVADARAFTYQQEGHGFFVLTFPAAQHTHVYDTATGLWHERAWRDPVSTAPLRWRYSTHVFFNNEHLVGDDTNGKFYKLDMSVNTDNGDPIYRMRTLQAVEKNQERLFFSMIQVDMETGYGGTLEMRWSDDGGNTYSAVKTTSLGAVGEFNHRVIFRRLGSGRQGRIFEISTLSDVKWAIFGVLADVSGG